MTRPPGSSIPPPADELVELVDVVDEQDRVVVTVTRSAMRAGRLRHRAVFIAVIHPDGRLLVHRRSEDKDLWPGWWDIAVGGVVGHGETYDAAARRELAEEIGVHDAVPVALGGGPFVDDDVSLIGRCYRVQSSGPFTFADGEVLEAEWVALADLDRLLAERRFLPDSVALLLPVLRAD